MSDARFRRSLVRRLGAELEIRDRHVRKAAEAEHRANVLRRTIGFLDTATRLRREMDVLNGVARKMAEEVAEAQARNDAVLKVLARLEARSDARP